ncbi:MAG: hypothetical protein F6J86_00175 [Symploca sp. SIO1B1]|nr:hypothetical protein [Symploca sp. SIO1C2]NER51692.1 hypothetical protein [Symploca sp. SIO1A3]NER92286.1 hypothetical protein [Symploca sp. SIO1B1]
MNNVNKRFYFCDLNKRAEKPATSSRWIAIDGFFKKHGGSAAELQAV